MMPRPDYIIDRSHKRRGAIDVRLLLAVLCFTALGGLMAGWFLWSC
jgi:hypothetical protein